MYLKTKAQKLGQLIADFRQDIEYLQTLVNPSTTPKKAMEHKGDIEDITTQLEEIEKEAKTITDATT